MIKYGFCHLSQVAVRSEASHRSEMVNQLLFGETFEIIEGITNWKLIHGSFDKYEGFIEEKQFLPISSEDRMKLHGEKEFFPAELVSSLFDVENNRPCMIVQGSSLSGLKNNEILVAGRKYLFQGKKLEYTSENLRIRLLETALQYLGTPYLWGGRSPFGIDCS